MYVKGQKHSTLEYRAKSGEIALTFPHDRKVFAESALALM